MAETSGKVELSVSKNFTLSAIFEEDDDQSFDDLPVARSSATLLHDGEYIAVRSGSTVAFIKTQEGSTTFNASQECRITSLTSSPDEARFIVGLEAGDVLEYTRKRNANDAAWNERNVASLDAPVLAISSGPAGLVTVSSRNEIALLQAGRGSYEKTSVQLQGFESRVISIAVSSCGKYVTGGSETGEVVVFEQKDSWIQIAKRKFGSKKISTVAFSPSVLNVFAVSDSTVAVFDFLPSGDLIEAPFTYNFVTPITSFATITDEFVVISNEANTIVWRPDSGEEAAKVSASSDALAYNRAIGLAIVDDADVSFHTINELPEATPSPAVKSLAEQRKEQRTKLVDVRAAIKKLEAANELLAAEKAAATAQAEAERLRQESYDHNEAVSVSCMRILDELADCLEQTGIRQLKNELLWQFLIDVGHSEVLKTLRKQSGLELFNMPLSDLVHMPLPFPTAADVQLRMFLAEHHLASPPEFTLSESVLGWDQAATAKWIGEQGPQYEGMVEAKWTAAGLVAMKAGDIVEETLQSSKPVSEEQATALVNTFQEFLTKQQLPEWFADYVAFATKTEATVEENS